MFAFGIGDAFWYVVAAGGAAIMLGLVTGFRHFGRWMMGRAKAAYLSWFEEAIDTHIEPKFQRIRDETVAAAIEMKDDLRLHTQEEGEVVRVVVNEAMQPLREMLDSRAEMFSHLEDSLNATQVKLAEHMDHDDRVMERVGAQLKSGQDTLLRMLTRGQDREIEGNTP